MFIPGYAYVIAGVIVLISAIILAIIVVNRPVQESEDGQQPAISAELAAGQKELIRRRAELQEIRGR